MIWNALKLGGTLMYGSDNPPVVGSSGIIAVWDYDGEPIGAVNLAAYMAIRPLGNELDGTATEALDFTTVMGHAPRNLEPGKRWPDYLAPFDLEMRHQQITTGPWQGWGWRAEMRGSVGTRNPGVRAIGIYSDKECTMYLYTTGAFVQGQSAWQFDAAGEPLTVWYTECPLGQLKPTKGDWYFAVLYASIQEGKHTLSQNRTAVRALFWETTQAGTQPGSGAGGWVDTGVTIAQLVGAGVYRVSAAPTITLNQAIRLGDASAGETVFTGYWPTTGTPSDYIKITPHVSAAVGSKVWKWE
jgi:hypothetical protein